MNDIPPLISTVQLLMPVISLPAIGGTSVYDTVTIKYCRVVAVYVFVPMDTLGLFMVIKLAGAVVEISGILVPRDVPI